LIWESEGLNSLGTGNKWQDELNYPRRYRYDWWTYC
jgi:hypothetical protein